MNDEAKAKLAERQAKFEAYKANLKKSLVPKRDVMHELAKKLALKPAKLKDIAGLMVVKQTEEWRGSPGLDGTSSGFRRFIEISGTDVISPYAMGTVPVPTIEPLPSPGMAWNVDFSHLLLVRIEVKRAGGDNNAPRQFDCYYENRWINTQGLEDAGIAYDYMDLEISTESNAEVVTLMPNTTVGELAYRWQKADGAWPDVTQATYYMVQNTSIKIKRNILSLTNFEAVSKEIQGHVNLMTFYGLWAQGTVLYNGYTSSPFVDANNVQKWMIELSFTARIVTHETVPPVAPLPPGVGSLQDDADGWCYVLNEKRGAKTWPVWDRPFTVDEDGDAVYLYKPYDFDLLFETSKETATDCPINTGMVN